MERAALWSLETLMEEFAAMASAAGVLGSISVICGRTSRLEM